MNSDKIQKHVGKKLKIARAKSHYTQEELAEKISLSSRYISQLERGLAFGSADTIINICKALHINSDFLFGDLIEEKANIDKIDNKFEELYIQLDCKNKELLKLIANDMLKIQKENNEKNK